MVWPSCTHVRYPFEKTLRHLRLGIEPDCMTESIREYIVSMEQAFSIQYVPHTHSRILAIRAMKESHYQGTRITRRTTLKLLSEIRISCGLLHTVYLGWFP